MKKRSELKHDIQYLERENQRLRDIIATRAAPLLAILESKWFGVRYVRAKVSADGETWAVVHDHFEVEGRSGNEARENGEKVGAVVQVRELKP